MATLTWAIRSSLFHYVLSMARGEVTLTDGAEQTADGILFPSAGDAAHPLAFQGTVVLTGHNGLLRISISDPIIHREDDGRWLMSVVDDAGTRLPLADIEQIAEDESGLATGAPITLRPEGAQVFGGQYPAGSELDSVLIRM